MILEKRDLEDGGLLIYTTLDFGMQQAAQAALEKNLAAVERKPGFSHQTRGEFRAAKSAGSPVELNYLQGAVVMLDNTSGGIRALVGGRDFDESQYNRATMSRRQIGSLFKPFVYSAAYREGLLPGTLIDDGPLFPGEIKWTLTGGHWSPSNSDGLFNGLQPAEYGLIKSRNTMTVRVGEYAGIDNVIALSNQVGFQSSGGTLAATLYR